MPTIPVGWVESDLVPLPLPRALGKSRAGGGNVGDQILNLKWVPNFRMTMIERCDACRPLEPHLHKKPGQISKIFFRELLFKKLVFQKTSLEKKSKKTSFQITSFQKMTFLKN